MNTQINIIKNGTTTLATAGKYCDRNIDVIVDIPADTSNLDGVIARTATDYANDSATVIGPYAFNNYTALTAVDFSSVTTIQDYAFQGCGNLTAVNFPSVTDAYYGAFENTGLIYVTAENFPKISNLGHMLFNKCKTLEIVELSKIASLGNYIFAACYNLRKIKIGALPGVTLGMLQSCPALQVADFGTIATGGINGSAFLNDTSLTALIIRDTSRVVPLTLSAFDNTAILAGTGYVYVPSALVDSYKVATNWASFQNQIRAIEDYPEITGG